MTESCSVLAAGRYFGREWNAFADCLGEPGEWRGA
ncbi:barstar family protein [Streptomyces albogriseolus]